MRKASHHTFVIEREFGFEPALVFFAYANGDARTEWFSGPPNWEAGEKRFDFQVGGREYSAGGPKGGPAHIYTGTYLEIVPNERIINAFTMHLDDMILTSSQGTTEFRAGGRGTKLRYTEQIVFLDGSEHLADRIQGTEALFDQLEAYVSRKYAGQFHA